MSESKHTQKPDFTNKTLVISSISNLFKIFHFNCALHIVFIELISSYQSSTPYTLLFIKNEENKVLRVAMKATQRKDDSVSRGVKLQPFRSSKLTPNASSLEHLDHLLLFALTASAVLLRTYKLTEPPKVVFDEVNFGGFVQEYFLGRFFIDVHPPLVKLIYYAIAVLFRWDGEFDFDKIGAVYDSSTPYVAMRLFSAICGALTVPVTYLTLRASFCRSSVAAFGAFLVLVENSMATQSRFILLDAPLILFTALAVCSFQYFQQHTFGSSGYFTQLTATGIFLGLAVSTKLTGLFTIAWVGLWTAYSLWVRIGDLTVPVSSIVLDLACRLIGLLGLPLTIYMQIFSLHFQLLPYNGSGSGAVSPAFQAGFLDSDHLRNYAADVSFGSVITLRHHRLDTYLHSHSYVYKLGSGQQQVTMYGFSGDKNSEWIIESAGTNFEGKFDQKFRPIRHGDYVKLYHKSTQKYLRANDVRPPNSEHDYSNEVSCLGNRTDTEHSDYEWLVQITDVAPHANETARKTLKATQSIFKLVHKGTSCTLMGQNVFLPDWAFHQNQVLCMNDPTNTNIMWYIEKNTHPMIDNNLTDFPRIDLPQLLFFQKFVEYHAAMWRINNGFVKKHEYESLPHSWFFPIRGIAFFSNGHGSKNLTDEPGSHIYMLGNMAVYGFGIIIVLIFGIRYSFYLLKHINPFGVAPERVSTTQFFIKSAQYVSGWFFQFYPFLYLERKLFAHHYLSSVYFLILATAQFAEYQMCSHKIGGWVTMVVIGASAAYVYWTLFPLVSGSGWTVQQCQAAKWLPTWDFDCMAYSE